MPKLSQNTKPEQSNIIAFPQKTDPYVGIDINELLTGGKDGYTIHAVALDQHYVIKDSNMQPVWLIARVAV
ncbi:MAG TPA: hypothetical protein VHQ01_03655 [Pyrinomonadaceae bacterium]|jgi:hypothetical protein|nr:hypothetical protein [Pyrinomonadaceae bacterium]